MTIKDESVGVIPIFDSKGGERLFLLVHHKIGHWAFPKGHQDEGESVEKTIRRELREETGITEIKLDFDKEFIDRYTFEKHGGHIDKTVTYVLGFVKDREADEADDPTDEIEEVRWVSYEEALELLTYPESEAVLRSVDKHLLHQKND